MIVEQQQADREEVKAEAVSDVPVYVMKNIKFDGNPFKKGWEECPEDNKCPCGISFDLEPVVGVYDKIPEKGVGNPGEQIEQIVCSRIMNIVKIERLHTEQRIDNFRKKHCRN